MFAVSEDHTVIISAESVHLLDLPRQAFLWSIFVATPITAAALAPDRPLLVLGSLEETAFWDLSIGQIAQRLMRPVSESRGGKMLFGPGGILALTSLCEGVQLWNTETGQLLYTLIDEEGQYTQAPSFKSMAFSPDGEFLARRSPGKKSPATRGFCWRCSRASGIK